MLEELRAYENDLLDKHISFFELIRREDEDELASRYDVVSVNIHKVAVSFKSQKNANPPNIFILHFQRLRLNILVKLPVSAELQKNRSKNFLVFKRFHGTFIELF